MWTRATREATRRPARPRPCPAARTPGESVGAASRVCARPGFPLDRLIIGGPLPMPTREEVTSSGGVPPSGMDEDALANIGGMAAVPDVQRQAAPPLTEPQIQEAITFNRRRFVDPFTVTIVREVVGIPRWPGVSDRDLAIGVAQWQAAHPPLAVDGQVGPATTLAIVQELGALGQADRADLVHVDAPVTASTVGAVTRNVPAPAAHGLFRMDATFSTPLRRGWIIQEMVSTWNEVVCGGAAHPNPPTPHYWEAWWVTPGGNVRLPTALTTPPTHVATGAFDDRWQRGLAAGTRGNFTIASRLFTTLRLPAGFAFNAVADAGLLPSTAAAPDPDRLGLVSGRRRATGTWNGCPAPAVNIHTP